MSFAREQKRACPVVPFDRADEGYLSRVEEWLANPNAYFKAFGPEARAFQAKNRSERLRTMTLVMPAEKLVGLKPVRISLDGVCEAVVSWEDLFSVVASRLIPSYPGVFAALQEMGGLAWLGCERGAASVGDVLAAGALVPVFSSLVEVVYRVQWLFLLCGIRLNEVVVQADPYTDEEWQVRHAEIRRKRADEKKFMEGRRAAQKAWAQSHPEASDGERRAFL